MRRKKPLLRRLVNELDLPVRVANVLLAENVVRVGALTHCCVDDLERMRGLGAKSIGQIVSALAQHGLTLDMTDEPIPNDEETA
jgi:DNA-directed RNA polymerase subunit alpha